MVQTKCGFDSVSGGSSGVDLLISLGPTIAVDIGFDPTFDPAQLAAGKLPVPGIKGVHGLVDTGATESCIDNLLAAQLNLPIIDRRMIAGIAGSHHVNVYLRREMRHPVVGSDRQPKSAHWHVADLTILEECSPLFRKQRVTHLFSVNTDGAPLSVTRK